MKIFLTFLFLAVLSLEGAHGGGGRGGGGGGGHSFNRTPSMSRSGPPRQPMGRSQPMGIPQGPRKVSYGVQGRQMATPQQTAAFRNNWVNGRPGSSSRAHGSRSAFYNRHPGYNNWFSSGFYAGYNRRPAYWDSRTNYWGRNRWSDYNSWLGWGWQTPYIYDDSDDLYYSYTNYQADPAVTPSPPPQNDQWYPLGIFALSSSPDTASSSNFIYQLAVNQKGEVDGTLYNTTTQLVYDIEGTLNRETQVVSFRVANDQAPVMSTGLFNLTLDQTSLLVQFVDGSKQTWTLTRLSDSNQ